MNEISEISPECRHDNECECRHLSILQQVRKTVRKISHEMSQPLMVIQGYLELLELGKVGDDPDGMAHTLESVSVQVEKLREICGRLREVA